MNIPILYSFRRCPYCIRAHMTLNYSRQKVILRDVELRNLPQQVLDSSPNATVPALVFSKDEFMHESWDIMKWAIHQNDPHNWSGINGTYLQEAQLLVETNDFSFKSNLDKYKYASRYPEHPMEHYRHLCEEFLTQLNLKLEANNFLLADRITIADIAVFPFIRQFAMVDQVWFDHSPYPALQRWLSTMLSTEWFTEAFRKRDTWKTGSNNIYV